MSSFGTDGWMNRMIPAGLDGKGQKDDCLKAGMNSIREWMVAWRQG